MKTECYLSLKAIFKKIWETVTSKKSFKTRLFCSVKSVKSLKQNLNAIYLTKKSKISPFPDLKKRGRVKKKEFPFFKYVLRHPVSISDRQHIWRRRNRRESSLLPQILAVLNRTFGVPLEANKTWGFPSNLLSISVWMIRCVSVWSIDDFVGQYYYWWYLQCSVTAFRATLLWRQSKNGVQSISGSKKYPLCDLKRQMRLKRKGGIIVMVVVVQTPEGGLLCQIPFPD